MADIELVIKIPENTYHRIQTLVRTDYFEHDICGSSMRKIANGTPLPKGHGDLKDADKLKTREEAVKKLKDILAEATETDDSVCYVTPNDANVLKVAIKALEQEPCEDAISRQAYIERYRKWVYSEFGRKINNEALAIRVAMSLPPVTPQLKMGQWEWVQYDYDPKIGNWHCSECGGIVVHCVNKEAKDGIPLYKYCPHCGAKMQEVE